MPPAPVILLPPSEGRRVGGGGPAWVPGSMAIDLDGDRGRVLRALATAMRRSEGERGRLLGVKGEALRGRHRGEPRRSRGSDDARDPSIHGRAL